MIRRAILAVGLLAGLLAPLTAFAQGPPPPVPALPDSPRQTTYTISGSTCACSVGFQLYGDSNDYDSWIEVWLGGVRYPSTDPNHGWTITSATGQLTTIPRPIIDGVLTFNQTQTGTVIIVGAQRPRRLSEFTEGAGVPARAHNQTYNSITAMLRENWDKTNDLTGRGLFFAPGNTTGPMPSAAACAGAILGFDISGLNPVCLQLVGLSAGTLATPGSTVLGDLVTWGGTNGKTLLDGGPLTGIDQNILNNQGANYTIASTDCGKTIIYGTVGQFTITLPAVTGFPSNCSVLIKNSDNINSKILSGFPGYVNPLLYPRQDIGVKIVNASWRGFYLPSRYRPSASISLYVNGDGVGPGTSACGPTGALNCSPGVDTNDCLTPATACLTMQRANNLIIDDFDLHNFNATVYLAHGSSNNYAFTCTGGPVIGQSSYAVQGDSNAPTAVTMVATTGVAGVKDGCTVAISYVAFADNASNNASGFISTGTGNCGHVDLNTVSFGALAVGSALISSYCGSITVVGANAVTGSENAFIDVANTGAVEIDGTVAGSAGITWGTAAAVIQQGGVVTGVTPSTFTGFSGVSGPRCFISNMTSPDGSNPNKLYPGSTDCVVDVTVGALGVQSGSGGSSTIDYGTAGHALLSGGGGTAKDTWDTAGVSCAANSVSLTTLVITKGIVTHC